MIIFEYASKFARAFMEFKEQENDASGSVPDFGAIFMANSATKKECFRRHLFGMPHSYANFVKNVKDGMILFLFEYEKRKLYGVFRACSDGAMNIVPHAFSSSGKQFSAQVRFTRIWYCHPLSEHDFRDAIKDNYFSAYKFMFGLSKDQVQRLLWLFSSRKVRLQQPQKPLTGSKNAEHDGNISDKVRVTKKGRFETAESQENECSLSRGFDPVIIRRNAGFPQSNRNSSGYPKKHILETDDSIVDSQTRLYSPIPQALEPKVSNLMHSSHRDAAGTSNQPVCYLYGQLNNSIPPDYQHRQSSPFGINNNSIALQEFSGHPNSLETPFPCSRCQSNNFKLEPGNMSVNRRRSMDVTNYPGDYIPVVDSPESYEPSKFSSPPLGARYFQEDAIEHTNYEAYNGLRLSKSPVAPVPVSGSDPRRENSDYPTAYKGLPFTQSTVAPVHFSLSGDIRRENTNSPAAYKGFPLSESAVAPVPFSSGGDLRRASINSSAAYKDLVISESGAATMQFPRCMGEKLDSPTFVLGHSAPHHHYAVSSSSDHGHEGSPYGNYKASIHVPYRVWDDLQSTESQGQECCKHDDPIYYDDGYQNFKGLYSHGLNMRKCGKYDNQICHDDEGHQTFHGMHCDTKSKRISVFSRLNAPPKDAAGENDDFMAYTNNMDASVDDLMLMLHLSHKRWRKSMRKPKPTVKRNYNGDDDDNETFSDTKQVEMSRNAAPATSEEETWIDQKDEEVAYLNFKRRSETREKKAENGAKGCVEEDTQSECPPNKLLKRRKLVRPTFNSNESICEKEANSS